MKGIRDKVQNENVFQEEKKVTYTRKKTGK
jgi:hypothetical protein